MIVLETKSRNVKVSRIGKSLRIAREIAKRSWRFLTKSFLQRDHG